MRSTLFFFLFAGFHFLATAQFLPGNTYFGDSSYIEYIAGDLPIIISAPHGGYLEPTAIPDRNCSGCVYVRDSYTQELSRETYDAIRAEQGCSPHVIINRLHRKKLDANRDIGDAADGDPLGEHAWEEYHAFIDSAKAEVVRTFGAGIFLDMHGHGHAIQRIELGYLISGSELREPDDSLDTPDAIAGSAIRNLVATNPTLLEHSELVRGEKSLGALMMDRGVPAVPSDSIPFPLSGEAYFSGGFNTATHGSRSGGAIDAIQLEHHQDIRFTTSIRQDYADSLALILLDYVRLHYFPNLNPGNCTLMGIPSSSFAVGKIQLHPNPSTGQIELEGIEEEGKLQLRDPLGRLVMTLQITPQYGPIDLSALPAGRYHLTYIPAQGLPKRAALHLIHP